MKTPNTPCAVLKPSRLYAASAAHHLTSHLCGGTAAMLATCRQLSLLQLTVCTCASDQHLSTTAEVSGAQRSVPLHVTNNRYSAASCLNIIVDAAYCIRKQCCSTTAEVHVLLNNKGMHKWECVIWQECILWQDKEEELTRLLADIEGASEGDGRVGQRHEGCCQRHTRQ